MDPVHDWHQIARESLEKEMRLQAKLDELIEAHARCARAEVKHVFIIATSGARGAFRSHESAIAVVSRLIADEVYPERSVEIAKLNLED